MHLTVIGLNHKTAPVELREKLSISEEQIPTALSELRAATPVSECLILSTCNRTEVYAYTPSRSDDESIISWMGKFFRIAIEDFRPHLYFHAGHKAVEHLFRVSSGIDSMVIGEAQILGQVKDAYELARDCGVTGSVLNSLFQQAITVGKRARTESEIGRGAFSVGSVAVQIARSIFDDLKGRKVLVVGAGEMAELTIRHLVSSGVSDVAVANRTFERAEELAGRFCGRAVSFDDLPSALETADIVIASTGASEPVVTRALVAKAMHARRGRPMFFIDIAVPRDVEPQVATLDNVFVYDIDDLQFAVEADAADRQAEVRKVEAIIAEEVGEFITRFKTLQAVPVITAIREKLEGIRAQEFDKLKSKLKHLSEEDLEAIEAATRSIVNKICHQPVIQAREYAVGEDAPAKLETICELFGICPVDEKND